MLFPVHLTLISLETFRVGLKFKILTSSLPTMIPAFVTNASRVTTSLGLLISNFVSHFLSNIGCTNFLYIAMFNFIVAKVKSVLFLGGIASVELIGSA